MRKTIALVYLACMHIAFGCGKVEETESESSSASRSGAAVNSTDETQVQLRNGVEIQHAELPFVAGIFKQVTSGGTNYYQQHCTGSLINRSHVLTAAHCKPDTEAKLKELRVTFGRPTGEWLVEYKGVKYSVYTFDPANVYELSRFEAHPAFDFSESSVALSIRDLAVVTLTRPVEGIAPIELGIDYTFQPGAEFEVAGYGVDEANRTADRSGQLRVGVNVLGPPLFNIPSNTKDAMALHARYDNMQMICSGDSGGPVFRRTVEGFVLYGVSKSSNGKLCDEAVVGQATKVINELEWIRLQAGVDINPGKIDLTHELFGSATAYNWGGRQEKWITSQKSGQVFILPNGQIYHWDRRDTRTTFAKGALYSKMIGWVPASYYADTQPLIDGGTYPASSVGAFASSHKPSGEFSSFNWGGRQEYWLAREATATTPKVWFFLLPNGFIYEWDVRDTKANFAKPFVHSKLVARLDAEYYHRRATIMGGLDLASIVARNLQLTGAPSNFNWGGKNEWWFQGKTHALGNNWYFLEENGAVYAWNKKEPLTGRMCPCLESHQYIGRVSTAYHAAPQLLIDGTDLPGMD